ncbi:MAG: DUF1648 domain-containing protein [Cyanobacteria bacterium SZAS-4]|nr:DUF1648 domain-containing protein [Cyanobacteria bacterium SZAS-4]
MKADRPRLKLPLTKAEWALLVMTIVIVGGTVGIVAYYWTSLPDQITTHFDIMGTADRKGPKSTLLFLSAVSVVNCLLMLVLTRFPHTFNYLKPITEKNAASQYSLARKFMFVMNLEVSGLMFFAIWSCIQVSLGAAQSMDSSSLITLIVAIIISSAIYIFRANRAQ